MNNPDWTPPPPQQQQDSMYSDGSRQYYAEKVKSDTNKALIFGILSLFCCGIIFGWLGYQAADEALTNIDVYQVAQDKKTTAQVAKVLSIVGMVLWIIVIFLRLFAAVMSR